MVFFFIATSIEIGILKSFGSIATQLGLAVLLEDHICAYLKVVYHMVGMNCLTLLRNDLLCANSYALSML